MGLLQGIATLPYPQLAIFNGNCEREKALKTIAKGNSLSYLLIIVLSAVHGANERRCIVPLNTMIE